MVHPIIMQIRPILVPKWNGEVAMKLQNEWNYLGKDHKYVAGKNGGIAFAQSYSKTLFFVPDVDNTYQMMWNREEDAWMVQESSATCDENGDESNMTKICLGACESITVKKTFTPRVRARAADNVASRMRGKWGKKKTKAKRTSHLAGLNSANPMASLRKTKKKEARRRRLMGLIQSSGSKKECHPQDISDNNKGGKGDTECPTKCCLRSGDETNKLGKKRENTCLKIDELQQAGGEFGSVAFGKPCKCHAEVRSRGGGKRKVF